MKVVRTLQAVVEADDVERIGDALLVAAVHRRGDHPRWVQLVASPHHGCGDLSAFFRHFILKLPLLVADGPKDNGWRVAIALDHGLQLRQALGTRTHLARLAHHHHAHPVAALNPLRCRHIVRCSDRVAPHLAQYVQPEPLQPVGQRRAHPRVVLMVAGALNLQRLAIEEEPLGRIEDRGPHPKAHPLGIARLPIGLNRHNRRVEIRRIHRPQRRIGQLRGRGESH